MSRTYKDRPYRVKFPEEKRDFYYEYKPYIAEGINRYWPRGEYYCGLRWFSVKRPYILKKKARHVDSENHWMSTPGWWTHFYMDRPQRQASNQYMKQITLDVDLEELDPPMIGRKPHVYYW